MSRLAAVLLTVLLISIAGAQDDIVTAQLSQFGDGEGPTKVEFEYRLLDSAGSPGQSNALGIDVAQRGTYDRVSLRCSLRVLEGGDGGAFVFLNTAEYGERGPAPFVKNWVEPNLPGTFAVGIDVHDPKSEEPFGPWGNYMGLPEREVSLHFDGHELVKRVAPVEFRGDWTDCEITVKHVTGGADVTVRLAGEAVYDAYFVAGLLPYETRLAIGAGTRADASTEFDVKDIEWEFGEPAPAPRPSKRFEVFNHVLTNNSKTSYEAEVELPPANWEFGRVILTLDIHDAGRDWDEWDRNGHLYVIDPDGNKRDIVPFITSYRTECHWRVDVTHFRPWLAGKTTFEIAAGTTFYKNRGYMMSVGLDFHHGKEELEPYRVVPLWDGTAKYGSAENHFRDFFALQTVKIDDAAKSARVSISTTGHSQVGEFTPSDRSLVFVPDNRVESREGQRFENTLWKADCYLNPNRPQFGTWKYSRAGWAPGDVVRPWWVDLTPHLLPGETAQFRYEPKPYDFTGAPPDQLQTDKQINQASHVVRAYLILYREPGDTMPAPTLQVTNVAANSNAAKAGVKAGDYLASYDGKTLGSIDDLRQAIQGAAPVGTATVKAVLYRGAERLEIEIGPGRMGVGLSER